MTLYEMTDSVRQLFSLLESGEIDEQTYSDTVEAIGTEEKLEGYCQIIKQLKAEADMFKDEENRLANRRKALENNADKMRTAVLEYMAATGESKARAGTFSISISQSQSVEITDEDAIPPMYRTPQPDKVDKTAIKKALTNGETIAGAQLVSGSRLTIR